MSDATEGRPREDVRAAQGGCRLAIKAMCAHRQRLDPVGYERFVASLYPRMVVSRDPFIVRDLDEPHSGSVSATGRTDVTIVDGDDGAEEQ